MCKVSFPQQPYEHNIWASATYEAIINNWLGSTVSENHIYEYVSVEASS